MAEQKLTPLEELQLLQLEELREKRAQKEQERQTQVRYIASRKEEVERAKHAIETARLACGHRKPNMRPNVGGQFDHHGNVIFICQYCQQQWDQNTIPPSLRSGIDMQDIGGPHQVAS